MSRKNSKIINNYISDLGKISEEEKNELVIKLRRRMAENENLKKLQTDDDYLLRFLYSCDFDVDAAFEKMIHFYDLLLEFPEWFSKVSPKDCKPVLERDIRYLLPIEDKEGRPVYVVKLGNVSPSSMTLFDLVNVDCIWMEYMFSSTYTTKALQNGLSVILDVKNLSWRLVKWLSPHNIKIAIRRFETYPLRDYKIHIVNSSMFMNAGMKIIWPFLSQKLKDMVKFHFDDFSALHEHIDPDVLPPEYGGEKEHNTYEAYQMLYDKNDEIFENLLKYHLVKVE